jgi:hypothetical protein
MSWRSDDKRYVNSKCRNYYAIAGNPVWPASEGGGGGGNCGIC